ncbi:hypothetical protein P9F83_03200 [Peribacillus psychrosaccharolyticus]|nr:hypothetical protein [Peribacillus psychrosaccharolyticus]MEC2054242.1 hypothetical protein [Peribacillus psychrosaccharolyticus]MED3746593.1 hypothetical protein [Peribacillus psychrosaccharolyticus]
MRRDKYRSILHISIGWAAALRSNQKGSPPFCSSVRVASALKGSIATDCTANAYIPYVPVPFTAAPPYQTSRRTRTKEK